MAKQTKQPAKPKRKPRGKPFQKGEAWTGKRGRDLLLTDQNIRRVMGAHNGKKKSKDDIPLDAATIQPNGMPRGTPWQPGESGNLNGRPRSVVSFTDALIHVLLEPEPDDVQGRTRMELLALRIWADAYNGDRLLRDAIWNRLDGHISDDGMPPIHRPSSFGSKPTDTEEPEEAKVIDPYAPDTLAKAIDALVEVGIIPEEAIESIVRQDTAAVKNDEVHAEGAQSEATTIPTTE